MRDQETVKPRAPGSRTPRRLPGTAWVLISLAASGCHPRPDASAATAPSAGLATAGETRPDVSGPHLKPDAPLNEDLSRLLHPGLTGRYHRVAQGETLWAIARTSGVPLETLAADNGLTPQSKLHSGQWIFIRAATSAPAPLP